MQIIKVAKKGKKDVTVHFDDGKFLILALEVFLKSGLKRGDEISEDRFSFLIEQNKLFYIKQKAFRLLGRRMHSTSELRRKLWNKDYEQKLIEYVIDDLNKNGYLDDEEFIREFVTEKSKLKSWSTKRLKSELIKRGISRKQIDLILTGQPKEAEFENALKLAKKKFEVLSNRNLEAKELSNKLSTFLFSKGFDYDLIKYVCDEIIKNNSEKD